ncbi:hypothetical protein [Paenibacillus sp. 7541]|uniref:hypothetical protein n=1 Tax=Paenibacillus sp. 7541 TaxID=2026236 RepID=UPI0011409ACC|nr:hypothetical protein [Paenibacillus sp. 7541]
MKAIISEHEDNRNYGTRRMLLALSQIDLHQLQNRLSLIKKHGLLQKAKRHPNGITREDAAVGGAGLLQRRDRRPCHGRQHAQVTLHPSL